MITCPECGYHIAGTEFDFDEKFRERFNKKLSKQDNGCWLWTGYGNDEGYGRTNFHGRSIVAHRAAFLLNGQKIPQGMLVRHKCDVRRCCNPDHLELGTPQQNCQDTSDRGRCNPRIGSVNHNAVFTESQVAEIKIALRDKRSTIQELSDLHGVKFQTIYHIARGKTWAHVLPDSGCVIGVKPRKLTREQAEEIRRIVHSGEATQAQMARQYGISKPFVSRICNERRHGEHMQDRHPVTT